MLSVYLYILLLLHFQSYFLSTLSYVFSLFIYNETVIFATYQVEHEHRVEHNELI